MKCKTMVQCKLKRKDVVDVAWIPKKFAKVGKYLEIKGLNGWEVLEVWTAKSIEDVRKLEQDHKKTRIASDI